MRTHTVASTAALCLLLLACQQSVNAGAPDGNRMIALGRSNNPIPAGTWVSEVGGAYAEVRSDEILDEVTYDYDASGQDLLLFNRIAPDERAGFFVFEFSGFVDAVDMRTPSRSNPLTSQEFTDGLSQAAAISGVVESSIAGQDAVTWEIDPLDPDSEFSCTANDRSDLGEEDLCSTWSDDGARFVQFSDESVEAEYHYIETLGLIVAWSYSDAGTGNPFADLATALKLTPAA